MLARLGEVRDSIAAPLWRMAGNAALRKAKERQQQLAASVAAAASVGAAPAAQITASKSSAFAWLLGSRAPTTNKAPPLPVAAHLRHATA